MRTDSLGLRGRKVELRAPVRDVFFAVLLFMFGGRDCSNPESKIWSRGGDALRTMLRCLFGRFWSVGFGLILSVGEGMMSQSPLVLRLRLCKSTNHKNMSAGDDSKCRHCFSQFVPKINK